MGEAAGVSRTLCDFGFVLSVPAVQLTIVSQLSAEDIKHICQNTQTAGARELVSRHLHPICRETAYWNKWR